MNRGIAFKALYSNNPPMLGSQILKIERWQGKKGQFPETNSN